MNNLVIKAESGIIQRIISNMSDRKDDKIFNFFPYLKTKDLNITDSFMTICFSDIFEFSEHFAIYTMHMETDITSDEYRDPLYKLFHGFYRGIITNYTPSVFNIYIGKNRIENTFYIPIIISVFDTIFLAKIPQSKSTHLDYSMFTVLQYIQDLEIVGCVSKDSNSFFKYLLYLNSISSFYYVNKYPFFHTYHINKKYLKLLEETGILDINLLKDGLKKGNLDVDLFDEYPSFLEKVEKEHPELENQLINQNESE